MSKALQLGLRAGERIYINGAVLRVDRKVRIELLNDVAFLLESHVLQAEEATTPVRQLYFLIQGLLMDPASAGHLRPVLRTWIEAACATQTDANIIGEIRRAGELIAQDLVFEALKAVRVLIAAENQTSVGTHAFEFQPASTTAEATP